MLMLTPHRTIALTVRRRTAQKQCRFFDAAHKKKDPHKKEHRCSSAPHRKNDDALPHRTKI
jgi:hypothetical protein